MTRVDIDALFPELQEIWNQTPPSSRGLIIQRIQDKLGLSGQHEKRILWGIIRSTPFEEELLGHLHFIAKDVVLFMPGQLCLFSCTGLLMRNQGVRNEWDIRPLAYPGSGMPGSLGIYCPTSRHQNKAKKFPDCPALIDWETGGRHGSNGATLGIPKSRWNDLHLALLRHL